MCNLMSSYPKVGNGHGNVSWQVQKYGSPSTKSLILPAFQLPNAKAVIQFSNILALTAIHSPHQLSFVMPASAWSLKSHPPVHPDPIFPKFSNRQIRETPQTPPQSQKPMSKTLFSISSFLETSPSIKRTILSFGGWSRWSKSMGIPWPLIAKTFEPD